MILIALIGFSSNVFCQNVKADAVNMNSGRVSGGVFIESMKFTVHVQLTGDMLTYLNNGGAVNVTVSCNNVGLTSSVLKSSNTITIDKRWGGQADFGRGGVEFEFSSKENRDLWKNKLSTGQFSVSASKK